MRRLVPILLLCAVSACSNSDVESRLLAARAALDRGDTSTAASAFAEIADESEPHSPAWIRAKLGGACTMAAELPARAVRDFAEIADADPRAVLLDDWISAVGWLAGAGHYDDANALLAVARSHVAADATDRLDALARAIEIYRLRFPPSDGLIDARPKWEGTEFVASSEFAPLCTLATTSSTDAYKRYLDVARDRALSADDYGALALALYRAGDRERARWVMWNASLDHGGDARIVDFADFLRCGGNRDLLELRAICDY